MNNMIKTEKFEVKKSNKSVFSTSGPYPVTTWKGVVYKTETYFDTLSAKLHYDLYFIWSRSRYDKRYYNNSFLIADFNTPPKVMTEEICFTPVRSGFRLFFINLDWKCPVDSTNKVFYRTYSSKVCVDFFNAVSNRVWTKLEYNGYYTMVKVERWGIDFFKAVKPVYAIPSLTSLQFKFVYPNGGYLGLAKSM